MVNLQGCNRLMFFVLIRYKSDCLIASLVLLTKQKSIKTKQV